ncbi:MAG: hypothetical protein ACTSUO_01365 [Candidatus Thorarchaeota archaeon]
MAEKNRTNYIYEFTYNSGPGMKEIFQCKYVRPDEALGRFQKILALTQSPFDFKIVLSDDSSGEESSFQVKGGIDEMFEKFKVFLETSTGYAFVAVPTETDIIDYDKIDFESMSNYEKLQITIYGSFKHGKFSSLDIMEIYEDTFDEKLPKSTASTYLARLWNDGSGHLERFGSRSGYTYRLKTESEDVQKEIERAEDILATVQIRVDK